VNDKYSNPTNEPFVHFTCCHVGLQPLTDIHWREIPTGRKDWPIKYIARVGVVIFGSICDPESDVSDPFEEGFHENYVEGMGMTKEIALKKLKENFADLAESIHY
jgi:hypothetical protein